MKYNNLIPELTVTNLEESKRFYINILGFKVEYERPESGFVYLSYQGSQIMLDSGNSEGSPWYTGKLEKPFGRGVHFQLDTDEVDILVKKLKENNWELKDEPKIHKFRKDDELVVVKGFLVMDPDGYLLMFNQGMPREKL
jgi:lactoylglutathione lyase